MGNGSRELGGANRRLVDSHRCPYSGAEQYCYETSAEFERAPLVMEQKIETTMLLPPKSTVDLDTCGPTASRSPTLALAALVHG
jgi:hypothetical protein